MKFFRKSRPQWAFESLWGSSFHLLSQIWQMTTLIRSEDSLKTKEELVSFIESKSEKAQNIADEVFEISREMSDRFYRQYPEPYKNQSYKTVSEICDFQNDLAMLELRLFLFKDVLNQIDESHPKWKELNATFQTNYEKLIGTKNLINEMISETSQATYYAVIIARSIDENISFEEAEKRERKRWE